MARKLEEPFFDRWYGKVLLAVIPSVAAFTLGHFMPANYVFYINNDEVKVTKAEVIEIYGENERLAELNAQISEENSRLEAEIEALKSKESTAESAPTEGIPVKNPSAGGVEEKPVKLSAVKVSSSRFFEHHADKALEDTVGNKYAAGNLFSFYSGSKDSYGNAILYMDKKYKYISGTIAVSDASEDPDDIVLSGRIEIYIKNNDQESLIYESPVLSRVTGQIKFEDLDIAEAQWLDIRYYNDSGYYYLGYHSLQVILADAVLY